MMATTMMAMAVLTASWSQGSFAHHQGPFAKPVFAVMEFQELGHPYVTPPVWAARRAL